MAIQQRTRSGRSGASTNGARPADQDYDRELAWISEHREELFPAHAGKWIAVAADSLVAAADDLPSLMRRAVERGYPHPFVTHIPVEPIRNLYV
jgi:hypothetical protein